MTAGTGTNGGPAGDDRERISQNTQGQKREPEAELGKPPRAPREHEQARTHDAVGNDHDQHADSQEL